jgi:hypothetical protein
MARDNLNQIGKIFKGNQDKVRFVTRRIAENYPAVERSLDVVGVEFPYSLEFLLYKKPYKPNLVLLNLDINEVFDPNAVALSLDVPITISATGLGVGNDGKVGAQGVWYSLAYLGDLNFILGDEFSVVIEFTTQGTNVSAFKIVFDEGAVDLTNQTVITSTTATIPITGPDVLNTGQTIIHNAYIYSKVLSFGSASDWVYYTAYTVFKNGLVYLPRTSLL